MPANGVPARMPCSVPAHKTHTRFFLTTTIKKQRKSFVPQRHVDFTKGLKDSEVAQHFCVPLGIKAVKEVD